MKKLILILYSIPLIAQNGNVGINTSIPNASLQIDAKNASVPENSAGVTFPIISHFPLVLPEAN